MKSLDPRIAADPTWPAVEVRLDALARAGVDVPSAIHTALTGTSAGRGTAKTPGTPGPGTRAGSPEADARPLPDDLPAAALWWRICRTTGPAALTGRSPTYRPPWFGVLAAELGQRRADRVVTDPAWTSLLAAVNQAHRGGLDPDHIVAVAAQLTEPARTHADGGIADTDLARALAVRVTSLTHHDQVTFTTAQHRAGEAPVEDEPPPEDEPPHGHDPDDGPDGGPDAGYYAEHLLAADLAADQAAGAVPTAAPHEDVPWQQAPPLSDNDVWLDIAELHHRLEAVSQDRQTVDVLLRLRPPAGHVHEPPGDDAGHTRLAALNEAAASYYADQLPGSWAARYVRDRLGTGSPTASPMSSTTGADGHSRAGTATTRLRAGYAPTGWTALTDHLRATMDATDTELVDAGLSRVSSRGALIDAFRDRVVLPLLEPTQARPEQPRRPSPPDEQVEQGQQGPQGQRAQQGESTEPLPHTVVGFVGRRNPARDADEHAGPKYLNTRSTALYTKRSHLFGLTDLVDATRRAGAGAGAGLVPVLVEGPFDAAAVTAAGGGRYVGVAALGTALTGQHVDRLLTCAAAVARTTERPGVPRGGRVLLATDADDAGRRSAAAAFRLLTGRGVSPDHVPLPEGMDPADVLRHHGSQALLTPMDDAQPMARILIGDLACSAADFAETRVWAMKQAAEVIAAVPPHDWKHLLQLAQDTTLAGPETAVGCLLDAARTHTDRLREQVALPAALIRSPSTSTVQRAKPAGGDRPAVAQAAGTPRHSKDGAPRGR